MPRRGEAIACAVLAMATAAHVGEAATSCLDPAPAGGVGGVGGPRPGGGHALPETILAAYANWGQCDDKIVQAVRDGVNVIIWFSVNLALDEATGAPSITGPATGAEYLGCVAKRVREIRAINPGVAHLVSIGGWNSPHPDTSLSGREWFRVWERWNAEEVARPGEGWHGFQGFDWDIEGNDDGKHHGNVFTLAVLDLMGEMSVEAEAGGFLVAMAPAQSYMDHTTSQFSRSVDFPPNDPWHPDFFYAGCALPRESLFPRTPLHPPFPHVRTWTGACHLQASARPADKPRHAVR